MAEETHKLQKEPAEGSRKVVDHELARQSGKAGSKPLDERREAGDSGKARPRPSR